MIRKLISKFTKSISERAASERRSFEIPIMISFEPRKITGKLNAGTAAATATLSIRGETKDLSKTGISFVVPSIRLRENYLVGNGRALNAEITLPGGKLNMQIVGQRYEQISDNHSSATKYLIGASIARMSGEDREVYEEFLRCGNEMQRKAGSFSLGIDKS